MKHIITWLKSLFSSDDKPVTVYFRRNPAECFEPVRSEKCKNID